MPRSDDLGPQKVSTIITWLLATYGNLRYFVGRDLLGKHNPYHVGDTPFTINIIVTMLFWGVLFFLQILFVSQIFIPAVNEGGNRTELSRHIAVHFSAFNLLQFVWTLLFVNKHYFWSEVILVINFVNIISLYFEHKTYSIRPLSSWAMVHLATAAFPFAWLLVAIFWNGAVWLHVHKFFGRVVCNILIWWLLLIPEFFVLIFGDWGLGLAASGLIFGLGLAQLFTKVFALQWIFAFIISGILFASTVVVAITGAPKKSANIESAPLLQETEIVVTE